MTTISSFYNRLKKIGIEIELSGNYPWVYLEKVNGYKVHERFYGNHGFTVFFLAGEPNAKASITDIPTVFKKIRSMLTEKGRKQDHKEYKKFAEDYHQ
jgi:hypothetical protein